MAKAKKAPVKKPALKVVQNAKKRVITKKLGRPPVLGVVGAISKARSLIKAGYTQKAVANTLGVDPHTLRRALAA